MKIRNSEGKDKRIVSLICAVIFFAITIALTVFSFFFKNDFANTNGIESLALIVTLPLLIVYFIVLFAFNVGSIFYGTLTATSINKSYRITGIVFASVSAAILLLNIFMTITIFGLI